MASRRKKDDLPAEEELQRQERENEISTGSRKRTHPHEIVTEVDEDPRLYETAELEDQEHGRDPEDRVKEEDAGSHPRGRKLA